MTGTGPTLTKRELNLRIFRRQEVPTVLWQPRIEPWFAWHKEMGRLPERYRDMTVQGLFDDLDISMRYVHYYTDNPEPVVSVLDDEVRRRTEAEGERRKIIIETPHGDLVQEEHLTVDKTWRTVGFPVKGAQDLDALKWVLERMHYTFVAENFQEGARYVGDRGEPQFWVPKSPYQALAQVWMKLDGLIYALADVPDKVEEVMALIDRSYDPLYEQLPAAGMVNIVNFGENIHDHLLSPSYFERYLIPFWERRCEQLHAAGIYSHVHIDGYFHSLLPYLAQLPFDGIEALTPKPQGDVTLDEIAEHIGDKILLDGIPAIYFLPSCPLDVLDECVEKIVNMFHPRLVLGISDEIPEGVDESGLERVRRIGDYCRRRAVNM